MHATFESLGRALPMAVLSTWKKALVTLAILSLLASLNLSRLGQFSAQV